VDHQVGWAAVDRGPDPVAPAGEAAPPVGSLKIKQRRSWRTWHLVTVAVVSVLIGMAVSSKSPATSAASANKAYTPPPPAGSTSGSTTTSVATAGPGSTTTSQPATTSTVPASTAAGAGSSQLQTLVPRTQSQGDWTSPAFTVVGGQWFVGWAFQCSPVPASGPSFEVYVVPSGTQPSGSPAVTISGASGNAVTPETTPGAQQIVVHAPPGCVWVVKVTGNGTASG
jgi:hypothetical protein